jgi:hypothetical protein
VPSTKSSRSRILKLEAKAILASIPSTVLAGVAAICDHSRRRHSLNSFSRRLSSGKPTASLASPRKGLPAAQASTAPRPASVARRSPAARTRSMTTSRFEVHRVSLSPRTAEGRE